MRFVTARQAIIDAYSGSLKTLWDADDFGDPEVARRLYCSECRRAGLRLMPADPGDARKRWRCTHCKVVITKPLAMKPRAMALRSTNAGAPDNDYRICDALEAAKVMAVVDGLPVPERVWALYAYTETLDPAAAEDKLLDWLCDALDNSPPCELAKLGTLKKALRLMLMLIQEERRLCNGGKPLWSCAEMSAKIGVHRSQFDKSRHWGIFVTAARRHLQALNDSALRPVGALVADMRSREQAMA